MVINAFELNLKRNNFLICIHFNAHFAYIVDKIAQLDKFVENTSDTLNKLAIVAKLKPGEIKNWIQTVIKEIEKELSNFSDDYEERLNEVDKVYKNYNEPVKATKIKLDELQDLVGSPAHPETLKLMEDRDRNYRAEVVKKNELLRNFVATLKEKKKSSMDHFYILKLLLFL